MFERRAGSGRASGATAFYERFGSVERMKGTFERRKEKKRIKKAKISN
jgi:hypothetical protein